MKKLIITLFVTALLFSCETTKDVSIYMGPDGTRITTPEMKYDSNDNEEPPSVNEEALDDAIKEVQEE